ncbi:MAG: hypothetical protein ACRDD4_10215, partial [Culicoidibacterales bacterium]
PRDDYPHSAFSILPNFCQNAKSSKLRKNSSFFRCFLLSKLAKTPYTLKSILVLQKQVNQGKGVK